MDMQLVSRDMSTPNGCAGDDAFSMADDLESCSQTPVENPFSKYSDDPPALIAVMGVTGSGKTTLVNRASGSCLKVGKDLRSCTSKIQESEEFILDGRRVVLVDTPGFDDTYKSDTDVLKSIAAFLGESYSAGGKLAGVIYVHRISDDRFGGVAVKNFRMFGKLCGEKTLKNVIIMTNMWGRVALQEGEDREQQLKNEYFKAAIEKGAQLCRHDNTPESARAILRMILKNTPAVLRVQHELIEERKGIEQTEAGEELNREICMVLVKHQKDIDGLEKGMQEAIEDDDQETQEELEEEKKRLQEEMRELRKTMKEMKSTFEEARREMEERMNAGFKEQLGRLQEGYEAEIRKYKQKVRELERDEQKNSSEITVLRMGMSELRKKAGEAHEKGSKWGCIIM